MNTLPCRVQAAIYDGTKQIASIANARGVPAYGGNVLVTLSSKVRKLVQDAPGHRLPVTVAVRSSVGKRVTKMIDMVPYTTSGPAPLRRTGSSSALQIIGKTSFVDNGRVGGVLVACSSLTPCQATVTVGRGGTPISTPRTQTVGSGELAYLTYTLTSAGHQLLVAAKGNQLGARVTVATAPAAPTHAGPGGDDDHDDHHNHPGSDDADHHDHHSGRDHAGADPDARPAGVERRCASAALGEVGEVGGQDRLGQPGGRLRVAGQLPLEDRDRPRVRGSATGVPVRPVASGPPGGRTATKDGPQWVASPSGTARTCVSVNE